MCHDQHLLASQSSIDQCNGTVHLCFSTFVTPVAHHHMLTWFPGCVMCQQACVEVWYVDNQTTMSSVRFENNLCANTGDLGWSANQRPDPAGRVFCAYHNSAITTNLSVVNNVFIQTAGMPSLPHLTLRPAVLILVAHLCAAVGSPAEAEQQQPTVADQCTAL